MSNYSSNPQVVAAAGAVAGVALYALAQRAMKPKGGILAPTAATTAAKFEASATLSESESLTACGTMLICTQNLAVSGANQVALNIVEGHVWRGNVVVLSPSNGPFAKEFADLGVAVWIGGLDELLKRVRDVRVAICNTIMTAHLVNHLTEEKIPSMWILHEWWPEEMMIEELSKQLGLFLARLRANYCTPPRDYQEVFFTWGGGHPHVNKNNGRRKWCKPTVSGQGE